MIKQTYARVALLLLALLILPAAAFAQDSRTDQEILGNLERLRFSEDEIQAVTEVQERYAEARRIPLAELEVLRARITREMVNDDPDLREIEELIREGMEFEIRIRMAEIRREVEMQEIIGQRRWAMMKQLGRGLAERGVNIELLADRVRSGRPELLPTLRMIQLHAIDAN
jgi:hypothetical protein